MQNISLNWWLLKQGKNKDCFYFMNMLMAFSHCLHGMCKKIFSLNRINKINTINTINTNISDKHHQLGVTLVELLVVIFIMAILLSIGVPSFQSLIAQNRVSSAANVLQSSLQFARSTAIAQSAPVTICVANFSTTPTSCQINNNNWHLGWAIISNGQVLREQPPFRQSTIIMGRSQWVYSSAGTLVGQSLSSFNLNVSTGGGATRHICMSMSGTSRVIQGDDVC